MSFRNGWVQGTAKFLCAVWLMIGTAEAGQVPEPDSPQGEEQRPQTVGQQPEKANEQYREIEALFERQGVLTPRNRLVMEFSNQYSFSSSTRVALIGYTIIPAVTIGLIDVRSVNRHTYVGSMSGRYGITNRLELETRVPYVVRDDLAATQPLATGSPDSVFSSYGNSLGDVEFGLRYQLNMPKGNSHIFIAGLRAKSDTGRGPFEVPIDRTTRLPTQLATGSGFWAVQPNMTVIFPSDPAVFFGSVSYLYNVDRSIPEFGKISPGNTIAGNFGIGYSVNEKTSFSLGYEHSVVLKTKQNGQTLVNARSAFLGSFLVGVAYRTGSNLNFNLSLSGGLTEDAPDVQVTLRIPFSIDFVRRR